MTNEQAALIAAAALHGGNGADSQSWRVFNTAREFISWLEEWNRQ
jgi:hypothetical protein